MRGDQEVGHAPERAVRRQRLRVDNSEAGACEMAGAQRVDRVLGHDAAIARDIDEVGAALTREKSWASNMPTCRMTPVSSESGNRFRRAAPSAC